MRAQFGVLEPPDLASDGANFAVCALALAVGISCAGGLNQPPRGEVTGGGSSEAPADIGLIEPAIALSASDVRSHVYVCGRVTPDPPRLESEVVGVKFLPAVVQVWVKSYFAQDTTVVQECVIWSVFTVMALLLLVELKARAREAEETVEPGGIELKAN
jgi:hypothetical protein